MRYFCTYFDRQYLSRGLALHASLVRHCPAFTLWALCLDGDTYDMMIRLRRPGLEPIALEELEAYDRPLAAVKPQQLLVLWEDTRSGRRQLRYVTGFRSR